MPACGGAKNDYPARDEAVFFGMQALAGVSVVSPIQLYLDLLPVAGRGEEAASEIMAREIKPLLEMSQSWNALAGVAKHGEVTKVTPVGNLVRIGS